MSPLSLRRRQWVPAVLVLGISACDGGSPSPTVASASSSFLAGTWQGNVTIQVNPGDPGAPPPSSGPMSWFFEVTAQTNQQSFRTTVRSEHSWLPITTTATTAISPTNTPPTQISTQGEFTSPRGCRGTFGSVGTALAKRIEADFTGIDCNQATFTGQLVLTKN
jgi:hypothetical protein